MHRDIWFTVNGKRSVVGSGTCFRAYAKRQITSRALKPINTDNEYFLMLESQLRDRGYDPIIYTDGRIQLTIPCNDAYGWIFREIARSYWLTLHREGKL